MWDYPRASWQYDVMVGLILAFIFLTPRELFRDQPRPKNVMLLHSEFGASRYLIEPELLAGADDAARLRQAQQLIRSQADGKNRTVESLEPVFDPDKELRGYIAYTRP